MSLRSSFPPQLEEDHAAIRMHIPQEQGTSISDGQTAEAGESPLPADSLSHHISQLHSAARTQLVQGEMLHAYLLLPPPLLERHPWLHLPWGRKLQRAERQRAMRLHPGGGDAVTKAADAAAASALDRAHPCPHHMHVRLRVVGAAESDRHALAVQAAALADDDDQQRRSAGGEEGAEDDEEDDGGDIVHDGEATDSDADAEEVGRLARPAMGRSVTASESSGSSSAGASPSRPRASTTTRSSSRRSSAGGADTLASKRFAFRKSTLTLPSASPSRRERHHPGKLAPGYSPFFHAGAGHPSTVSPLNHLHSDQHSTPGCDERATMPPVVSYFYYDPTAPTDPASSDTSASASAASATSATTSEQTAGSAGPSPNAFLVLHVQTVISILPSFLSSPSAPPFGSSLAGHGGASGASGGGLEGGSDSGAQAGESHSAQLQQQLLALELSLLSPPARHHQALNHATLHLDNTGMFLVENQLPGSGAADAAAAAAAAAGASAAAGPASFGYTNLRAFVAQNRALQVPHLIPPARAYVTVVEPLQLSGKSICLSSGGGGGADFDLDENELSGGGGGGGSGSGADICVELTVLNLSSHWTVQLNRVEFLLNRSRVFLKQSPYPGQGSHVPASSPGGMGGGGGGGFPASAATRGEHRSVHYLPLGHFYSSSMADDSMLPMRLSPHEQVNLLCFLAAPPPGGGPRGVGALEALVRGLLAGGGGGGGAGQSLAQAQASFSLATTALPYRTPFTVHYSVDGVGEQPALATGGGAAGGGGVVQQNKVVWRSVGVGNSSASSGGGGGAATAQPSGSSSKTPAPSPRLDRWNALSPPSFPSTGAAATAPQPQASKLSLRFKTCSPAPLHRTFPVFLTVANHGALPTAPLQLVVLPQSHPVVRRAAAVARRELASQAFTRADGGADAAVAGGLVFGGAAASGQPFSPSSPAAPPLLFSPHTPFSPNTPSRHGGSGGGGPEGGDLADSPRVAMQHFPFQAVEHAVANRRRNSVQGQGLGQGQRAPPAPVLPRSASGTVGLTESAVATSAAGAHPRAGMSVQTGASSQREGVLSRQDSTSSTSSGEVLTTTLAHFLADAPPPLPFSSSGTGAAATHDLAGDEPAGELREDSSSSLVCLETAVSLGVIPAQGERSVTLHHLALREGMLSLSTLFLYDPAADLYYRPVHTATVFAIKR